MHNVTYIIIEIGMLGNLKESVKCMETGAIDWVTFLRAVRQFPHLQQIVIQCNRYTVPALRARKMLVELLAHLGGEWSDLDGLLGLYSYDDGGPGWDGAGWVQLQLDITMIDEIKQKV